MLVYLLTSRAMAAGVGELVQEGGPVKKADDLRRVLEERVLGETKRTEHEKQVLKHCNCKSATNMLLKYPCTACPPL